MLKLQHTELGNTINLFSQYVLSAATTLQQAFTLLHESLGPAYVSVSEDRSGLRTRAHPSGDALDRPHGASTG